MLCVCIKNDACRYVDENVYHGEFFEDEIHGRGRLTICPGSILEEVYDGDFVRGIKHGHGVYVYRKGDGLVRQTERQGERERGGAGAEGERRA